MYDRLAAIGVTDVRPLAGGASSLTFQGLMDGERVVVKVAPAGHEPVGHRDVLRQARMIDALRSTDVPVPRVRWQDAGAPPDVPPLFVMTMVGGESFEPLFDDVTATPNEVVAQRYRNAASAMATLHRLAPQHLGVGDEPVVDPAAEVERWCATLRTVDQELVPAWSETADLLRAGLPAGMGPSVVHGDFRLGNLLAVGADVAAVIDWEIWSVGDPRIDVGWFLVNADPATYSRPSAYVDAVPPRTDLLRCYGEVPDVEWFMALACFKSAATWALIVKHNRRRSTPKPELEAMAPVVGRLLERATQPWTNVET
ncbi:MULTISPECIES: phosphotransferase family protein [unclassified Mycobacterium]|uniref:phosphotransferase family protein n=1 Tax=unclassified Mycobacterium TaxID=2642494 RepID=UPI0029C89C39|nr:MULTISPECIES: phosphotransferase family protein [unclassified Mycobacterium]